MKKRILFITSLILITGMHAQQSNVFPASGNVGIGTDTPEAALHIESDADVGKGKTPPLLIGTRDDYHMAIDRNEIGAFKNNENANLHLNIESSSHTILNTGSGFVGIGSNPEEKLDINGNLKMRIGEGFKILGDKDYFGTHKDGIIFQMEDVNANNGRTDGGFVFRGHTPTDGQYEEWMVIKTGGNVGIGTDTPEAALHIESDADVGKGKTPPLLIGTRDDYHMAIDRNEIGAFKNNENANLHLNIESSSHTILNTGSGFVGIGSNPEEKLDINGNLKMRIGEGFKILGDKDYFGTHKDGIIFQMEDVNANNGRTDGGFVFRGHTPTDGQYEEWMVIKTGGDVGIGVASPTEKLEVSGTVKATHFVGTGFEITGKIDLNDGGKSVFIGHNAGVNDDKTDNFNVAVGYQSFASNTSGGFNTAIGYQSLRANTSGRYNTALGLKTLYENSSGESNTATGYKAMRSNTTGYKNTANGVFAMRNNESGKQNTAIGQNALYHNTSGDNNVAAGYNAGKDSFNGTNNLAANGLYIGAFSKSLNQDGVNEIVIGYNAIGAGSNSVVLGNDDILKTLLKGDVGIGTNEPDAKLSVNGKIHTKEVKVDLEDWSDFVFEEDYALPTLKEVAQHISEKGHLKDIPSGEEVLEHGILLGEMNAKLLQKIEELTLYTLEQEEKLKNQESRLSLLEKSIELLTSEKVVLHETKKVCK